MGFGILGKGERGHIQVEGWEWVQWQSFSPSIRRGDGGLASKGSIMCRLAQHTHGLCPFRHYNLNYALSLMGLGAYVTKSP